MRVCSERALPSVPENQLTRSSHRSVEIRPPLPRFAPSHVSLCVRPDPSTATVAFVALTARTAEREARAAPPAPAGDAYTRIRAASRRLFAVAILLALVAHVPALPLDATFLARLLLHSSSPPPDTAEPENEETLIPIDLDLLAGAPRTADGPAAPTTAEPPSAQAGAGAGEGPAAAPSAAATPAPEKPAVAATARPDDIYDGLDKPRHATATLKDPLAV